MQSGHISTALAQSIGSAQVPNAWEASAIFYDVGAPSSDMPTPPTPRSTDFSTTGRSSRWSDRP
eukprot:5381739-Lingulodinium_polyedra.AAC.1